MIEFITQNKIAELEAFLQKHPKGHFLQSHDWAKVKGSWKWEAVAVRGEDGQIRAAVSVLIRKMPALPYTLMYAARGPVCDPHDEASLRELTQGLEALAKKHHAYALKLDPDIQSSDTEFLAIMEKLGYTRNAGGKNFEGIQPNYVFRLDIKNKTEDELLAAFHEKTRYNLRLSVRRGVEVRLCDKEMLPDFSRLMNETGARDGFIVRSEGYFASILDALGENARLYMAFFEDKPIAGTLAIHYGNKVWYLYGASANENRRQMPNYQLQWAMIRWALETNCDIYDFRGVSGDLTPENPLYGLYLFKKGFGGDLVEFCGEFEMVYSRFARFVIDRGIGMARTLRHKLVVGRNRSKAAKEGPKQAETGEAAGEQNGK